MAVSTVTLALYVNIFGDFKIFLRDGALFVKQLGPVVLRLRQHFVRHCLPVIGERLRNVLALHLEQKLALGHRISQAGVNFNDAAGSQRNHWDVARYIRSYRAGHV